MGVEVALAVAVNVGVTEEVEDPEIVDEDESLMVGEDERLMVGEDESEMVDVADLE